MNKYLKILIHKIYIYGKDIDQKVKYGKMREQYQIPGSFRFNGEGILLYGDGKIRIGENTYIGSLSTLQVFIGAELLIGDNCTISHNVRMNTQSLVADQDLSSKSLQTYIGDVIIGDNVWIGANVFINPGVVIGSNAIVGANSVVTKNIRPFEIFGGVPAKLMRVKRLDAGT